MPTPYRTTQLGACAGCGKYREGLPCTTCKPRPGPRIKFEPSRSAPLNAYWSRLVLIKIANDNALVEGL